MNLLEAFERYARATADWSPPPATLLAPGLPATHVAQSVRDVGLEAPAALLEWFGVANGLRAPETGAQMYLGATPLSFDEALRHREELLDTIDVEQFSPSWFPFLRYDWAAVACIECDPAGARVGRAFLYEHAGGAAPGSLEPSEVLTLWADVIERGVIVQDPQRRIPVHTRNLRELLPADLLSSWLV